MIRPVSVPTTYFPRTAFSSMGVYYRTPYVIIIVVGRPYARGMTHVLPTMRRRPSCVDMWEKGCSGTYNSQTPIGIRRGYILIYTKCVMMVYTYLSYTIPQKISFTHIGDSHIYSRTHSSTEKTIFYL